MTNNNTKQKSLELQYGYQDKEDESLAHRQVVFSRRPTGADFVKAMEETDGANPEFLLNLMAEVISKFGEVRMPVPITVLLSLNWIDQEQLQEAFYEFLDETGGETEEKILEPGKVQLRFGIERDGARYDIVEFGKLLNGYDQIKIRMETTNAYDRNTLAIGREISRLSSSSDVTQTIEGGATLDELKNLDYESYINLQKAVEDWRDSFRKRGTNLS